MLRTVAFGSHKMKQSTTCRNLALQNLDFLLCFLRLPQILGGNPVNRSPCLAGCDVSPVQATRLHINSIAGDWITFLEPALPIVYELCQTPSPLVIPGCDVASLGVCCVTTPQSLDPPRRRLVFLQPRLVCLV